MVQQDANRSNTNKSIEFNTEELKKRSNYLKKASWVGIIGNSILAVLKIGAGVISNSLALLGDGIDTATDIVTSLVTLITAGIVAKPPDEKYPYGHGRAETLATKLLSFIIFFAGAQLSLITVEQIVSSSVRETPHVFAVYIAMISVIGKVFLAWYKFRVGRKTNSSMLVANAKNMVNDVFISISVLLGLFLTFIFNLPVLDNIIALGVGIWIMKVAFDIFMETNSELMDGLKNPTIYEKVFESALQVEGVCNPHKTRIRKFNTFYIIDMDIEVEGDLTVSQGHEIAKKVQQRIHRDLDNVYDVHVHVEPVGNIEKRERFGLSSSGFYEKKD